MKLKTKLLNAALLAALGVAGSAQAVMLGETGTGQVLLYPYYSVQGGNDTYISIVNTTMKAKAVKVRFLEGMNSKEVLDFNLYLSPEDVWVAAVTDDGNDGAKIRIYDKSCISPNIGPNASQSYTEQSFRTDALDDNGPKTMDRTREGYVEIIEMGEIDPAAMITRSSGSGTIGFAAAVKHANGVPADCQAVTNEWATGQFASFGADLGLTDPAGGLIGRGEVINVAKGINHTYSAVALDAFSDTPNHTYPGETLPSLIEASPQSSTVFYQGQVYTTDWVNAVGGAPADPVSAVLMHSRVMNEYYTAADLGAGTDWVINFPTKRFYVEDEVKAGGTQSLTIRPFTALFALDGTGACEPVKVMATDREEAADMTVPVSPRPRAGTDTLCWEVNVVTVNNSNVLMSKNLQYNVAPKYSAGWMYMKMYDTTPATFANHSMVAAAGKTYINGVADMTNAWTYRGLPVIGFMSQNYVNGAVSAGVLSNYNGTFAHKYDRLINY